MALSNLLTDKLDLTKAQAEAVQDEIVVILRDTAFRNEVYEGARFANLAAEDFSASDVHNVLDAAVSSLEDVT